ncbi:MAG: hypothetical protein PHO02_02580 [Candidatus Nanoarchaeia archaeon]|nr:hypothetical protein [Candidatus Nanoarchaeia archaeon]
MNALLAIAAGISLGANDNLNLSYSELSEIFPPPVSANEISDDRDNFSYSPFQHHFYSSSYFTSSGGFDFGYSFGIGKLGNLMSGEILNLTMLQGSIASEHARFYLDYSVNTSEFSGDFLEGLFTLKNVLGFSAEFPVSGFTPKVYANMRTRHLLSIGNEEIQLRAGINAGYAFLEHFAISVFYEHEWNIGREPDNLDRGGLGFVFSY